MTSDARGSVKITSADPAVHPALRFNYLSTEQDRREGVEAIPGARDILCQPAFLPYNGGGGPPRGAGGGRQGEPGPGGAPARNPPPPARPRPMGARPAC